MNFDRIAPHYRWLETVIFGNQLQLARVAFVREIEAPRRVLIVGEGDGRFLAEFVKAHPGAAVDCIDASGRMIELARMRAKDARVSFIHRDIRRVSLRVGCYDLIITHFLLDCLPGRALCEVVKNLAFAATADASWLLADFRIPVRGLRKIHAQLWIRAMYRFFRLTSELEAQRLHDPSPSLEAAGFECIRERLVRYGMIKSQLWRRSA